jgi:FkbM family methyltransferase
MDFRAFRKNLVPRRFRLEARRRLRDVALSTIGLERSYKPTAIIKHPELKVRSVLQFLVASELATNREFRFLQIGAYDGVGDDDLREPIVRHQLRGVLVEPQPAAFARLERTYSQQPQVTLLNAAIAEKEGTRTLFCPRHGDASVASFDRRHLVRHGIRPDEIVGRAVRCHTVESALAVAGLSHVDLLQTDAEGYDYQILRSVDYRRLAPIFVRFEFRHMRGRQINEIIGLLAGHGYRFFTEEKDIIAYRPRAMSATAVAA